jgi:hypothetical protein
MSRTTTPAERPIVCQRSSPSTTRSTYETAPGSSNTRAAASNETPCFRRLRFFLSSQAKIIIYTKLYHLCVSLIISPTQMGCATQKLGLGRNGLPAAFPVILKSAIEIRAAQRQNRVGFGGAVSEPNARPRWVTLAYGTRSLGSQPHRGQPGSGREVAAPHPRPIVTASRVAVGGNSTSLFVVAAFGQRWLASSRRRTFKVGRRRAVRHG